MPNNLNALLVVIESCFGLNLLKNTSNFKVSVEVSWIEFNYALEEFVCFLLIALLTCFYLSLYADCFIAIFEFVLL
jgi:hypothetical protein